MRRIATIISSLFIAVLLLAPVFLPQKAYADCNGDSKCQICEGAGLNGCTPGSGPTVNSIIATTVNVLTFVVGIAAVIMIIIAGLRYITANGDASSIQGAKNTLLYAIIGLVVVVFAQTLVRFAIDKSTGVKSPSPSSNSQQQPASCLPRAGVVCRR
jgi:hypothetical protein